MGTVEGLKYAGIGFLADRVLGTGFLGTLAGGLFGALFKPDAGEMNDAYDKRKATVNQTLKDFLGFEMPDGLFGNAASEGKKAESLRPSRKRAQANAEAREKKDGFPWGKVLLGAGAAILGLNLLDNFTMGPFSNPLFGPIGAWGNQGIFPGLAANIFPGVFPGVMPGFVGNPLMNMFGLSPLDFLF